MTNPEPVSGSPLKSWQWAELWMLVLVFAVQLWLYKVSVLAGAAWGLLVLALLVHMYFWITPLLRERPSQDGSDRQD